MIDAKKIAMDMSLTIRKTVKEVKKQQIDELLDRGVITKEQAANEYVRIAVEFSDAVDSIIELELSNKSEDR